MNRREFVAIAALPYLARAQRSAPASDYPAAPVSYRDVEINDAFWTPWLNKVRTVSKARLSRSAESYAISPAPRR